MWAVHHRDRWPIDAGGFVFADPFETVPRPMSASYLHDAWERWS